MCAVLSVKRLCSTIWWCGTVFIKPSNRVLSCHCICIMYQQCFNPRVKIELSSVWFGAAETVKDFVACVSVFGSVLTLVVSISLSLSLSLSFSLDFSLTHTQLKLCTGQLAKPPSHRATPSGAPLIQYGGSSPSRSSAQAFRRTLALAHAPPSRSAGGSLAPSSSGSCHHVCSSATSVRCGANHDREGVSAIPCHVGAQARRHAHWYTQRLSILLRI